MNQMAKFRLLLGFSVLLAGPTAGAAATPTAQAASGQAAAAPASQAAPAQAAPAATTQSGPAAPKAAAAGSKGGAAQGGEEQKTFYTLGVLLSGPLQNFQLTEAEFNQVRLGFADGFHHRASDAESQAYAPKVQALAQARMAMISQHEKEVGQAYLQKTAAAAPGAHKTASGLLYIPTVEGSGASPALGDQVKVNYEGKLVDGTVFDSSAMHGQAFTFTLGGVIPCWNEGLQLMKAGGKSRIICPSELAYADRGAPPKIKPGATLEFELELLAVTPGHPPAKPPGMPPGFAPSRPPGSPPAAPPASSAPER